MLRFSWNMLIADLKRNLRGAWWLGILFLTCTSILPFMVQPMSYLYFSMITLMLLQPQFTRIYFVAPLDEKKIRQIFLWRVAIISGMMLTIMLVFLVICHFLSEPVEKTGYGMVAFTITVFMLCSETSLQSFKDGQKKFKIRHIFAAIFIIVDAFSFAFYEEIDVKWIIVTNIVILILTFCYMLSYLRKLTFGDYVYVPVTWGSSGKVERN